MHSFYVRAAVGCAAAFLLTACDSETPLAPAPLACTYGVSTTALQAAATGQSFTVHVDTTATCAWTTRAQAAWLTASPASGTGPADVVVTVNGNDATAERTSAVTLAEHDVSVRQAGRTPASCTFTLESPSSTFSADGGPGLVNVVTAAGCSWSAASSATWLTLTTSGGNGPGAVLYSVARYDGTTQREARIAVDQASFSIRQDPPALAQCTYSVDPTSTQLHWHGSVSDGFDVRIETLSYCAWTASPDAPWIELVTPASGAGPTVVRVRIGAYTAETTRTAPLMIRWPAATAGQNVWIAQEGCRYATSLTSDNVPATGGRRRVSVFATPVTTSCAIGCPWDVSAHVPWIHIVGGGSRAGDDDLFYDVEANTTGAPRTGIVTIAGRALAVTQGASAVILQEVDAFPAAGLGTAREVAPLSKVRNLRSIGP